MNTQSIDKPQALPQALFLAVLTLAAAGYGARHHAPVPDSPAVMATPVQFHGGAVTERPDEVELMVFLHQNAGLH